MATCADATDCANEANGSVRNAATEAVDRTAVHLGADNGCRAELHPHGLRDRRARSRQSCSRLGCTFSCSPCDAIGSDPSLRPRSASCPSNHWWCWRVPSSLRCQSRVAFQRVMRDLLCGQPSAACPCAVWSSVRCACATPSRVFGYLALWQKYIYMGIPRTFIYCLAQATGYMCICIQCLLPQSVRVWVSVWRTRQHTLPF